MKAWMKWVAPLVVVAGAAAVTAGLILNRDPEVHAPVESRAPVVRVEDPERGEHRYRVRSQGVVQPAVEITFSAEVAGRVMAVAPGFAVGGFFEAGETLVQLDARDHELALERARAGLAEAEVRLQREEAEAAAAREEWEAVRGTGTASPLVARLPQLAEARALVASARAGVRLAELDVERSSLRAPFAGRVREKSVDVGQYVGRAQVVAKLFSVEAVEVRLALPLGDLAFVDMDLGRRGSGGKTGTGPAVRLEAVVGRDAGVWKGRIVRTEGEIEARTRMVTAVVRVEDPYGVKGEDGKSGPPLAVGLFVSAEIEGRDAGTVWRVNRTAMRGERLLVVDREDRLRMRSVGLLRMEGDVAILSGGVEEGDRVCLSPLATPVEGMLVEVMKPVDAAGEKGLGGKGDRG